MKKFIKGELRELKKLLVVNLKNGEEKIYPSIYKVYKEIDIFPKSITNSIEKYHGLLKKCKHRVCTCERLFYVKYI